MTTFQRFLLWPAQIVIALLAGPQSTYGQTGSPVASANSAASPQAPAYEVATIKPPAPGGFAMPLRVYIQMAYGIPANSSGWVIGPDWVNTSSYVIQGKPPESIRAAMQTMTPQERAEQTHRMQQALLADRFQLKAHFETRQMPMYQLALAKNGSKLQPSHDAGKGQAVVGQSSIRGTNVPVRVLADLLQSVPDIGGRIVVDKTGLPGNYDLSLQWTPMDTAAPSSTGNSLPSNAENPALFTAIEDQLGLKLVFMRAPGQVLIIDHIERPSEN